MKTRTSLRNRQGGAVAVMVGISMVVLVGFLALVIDLGHLYIAKTELQNAADAAALAGAKALNGTKWGCCDPGNPNSGVNKAIAIAAQNRYDFSKPVDITIANISVGNCPDPGCFIPASSVTDDTVAANKYFIKVDTGSRPLDTWFANIWNAFTTRTFGMAVAGRYLIDVTPLAMCALDKDKCPPPVGSCSTPPCDCGYVRGKAYDVWQVNNGALGLSTGAIYWLDPLATSANCTVTDVDDGRPFFCQGKAAFNTTIGSTVYTNTGTSKGPLFGALDSRFNDYDPQAQCDLVTAPPDENVREYLFTDTDVKAWMNSDPPTTPPTSPTTQTSNVTSGKAVQPVLTDNDGVVWSFSRPESSNPPISGRSANTPPYLASPWTPYTNLVTPPTGNGAAFKKPERRVLNLVVVACPSPDPGNCAASTVAGIGRFLLQRRTNVPSDKNIYVEYGGFIPGGPNVSEYKLYK